MLFIQVSPQRECPIILWLWLPHISIFFRESAYVKAIIPRGP